MEQYRMDDGFEKFLAWKMEERDNMIVPLIQR